MTDERIDIIFDECQHMLLPLYAVAQSVSFMFLIVSGKKGIISSRVSYN